MHRKHASGFTLIELLVVIAIIAILAAILFPVFAQAREKARQTSCVSNMKQLGTATIMYVQDYDESFPLAYGKYGGYWDFSYLMDVPANWRKTSTQADIDDFNCYWGNSTYAYTKNYQVLACPSTPQITTFAGTSTSYNAPPADVTYTYNGDLHGYSLAGVVNSSACPIVWEGDGKAKLKGSQWSNPQMYCGSGDCMYKPVTNGSCSGNGCIDYLWGDRNTDGPMTIHTGGQIFVYSDGHSKWRRVGATVQPARTSAMVDPYCTYDASGYSKLAWYDQYYYHAYLFRPDYDFTTEQKGYCGY